VLVVAMWQDHDARVLWEERFAQALSQNHIRRLRPTRRCLRRCRTAPLCSRKRATMALTE
jgi:hypothetical protein